MTRLVELSWLLPQVRLAWNGGEPRFGRRGAVARRRGLIAAASVVSRLADDSEPYGSPMHTRFTPRYTRSAVKQATLAALEAWTAEHPEAAAELRRRS